MTPAPSVQPTALRTDVVCSGPPEGAAAAAARAEEGGAICHPMSSLEYLREVTLPAVREGRARAEAAGEKWTENPFTLSGAAMVATGRDEEQFAKALAAMRERLAFYGSTPAYAGVLEQHGWDGLQSELNALAKQGRWKEMGSLIDDDVLSAFSVVSEDPAAAGVEIRKRYAGLLGRVNVVLPYEPDMDLAFEVLDAVRS
jgi:hypothetical protein